MSKQYFEPIMKHKHIKKLYKTIFHCIKCGHKFYTEMKKGGWSYRLVCDNCKNA